MNCTNCPYQNNPIYTGDRPMIVHPYGNPLTLQFPVKMMSVNVTNGAMSITERNVFERLTQFTLTFEFSRGKKVFPLRAMVIDESIVVPKVGTLGIGTYDITFTITTPSDSYRYKQRTLLKIQDFTEDGGQYENDEMNVLASYPVVEGDITAFTFNDGKAVIRENGKFKGDDTPNNGKAEIAAVYGDGQLVFEGGKAKIIL